MTLVEVFLILACLMVVMLLSAITMLLVVRRSNQIATRHRVAVPVRWLVTPGRAAQAHRRLRSAISTMRAVCPTPRRGRTGGPFADLADEVEALAVALDRELLDASRQPMAQRTPRLSALMVRITQVETLAGSITRLAEDGDPTRATPAQWQDRLVHTELRLAAIGDAQREVDELERQLGLQ